MPWALPTDPNPPDTVCIEAQVPNDPAYLDAFWGTILDLGAGFKWADDSGHTAILASRRMRQMYYQMVENNCSKPPTIINSPCSSCCEGCMAVRWNGCTLEEYDCLTQMWIPVPSINQPCVTNPAPGQGAGQPVGGQCASVDMSADASQLTPLPWLVSTGDTLNFTSLLGAGTDNGTDWYCPDGSIFFLGACAGGGHLSGSDPLPTTRHMALLLKIGSSYYPLVGGTFTVPSSISAVQPFVVVNDPTPGNCRGKYSIGVTYCNNAAPPTTTWRAHINFKLNSGGFVAGAGVSGSGGIWTPGIGWEGDHMTISGDPGYYGVQLQLVLVASTTFTSMRWIGNVETCGSEAVDGGFVYCGGTAFIAPFNVGDIEGNFDQSASNTGTGTQVALRLLNCYTGGSPSGSVTLTDFYLAGNGAIPSELVPFSY